MFDCGVCLCKEYRGGVEAPSHQGMNNLFAEIRNSLNSEFQNS